MTVLKEVFGMEASGTEAADKVSKALAMAAGGDMIVGGVVGIL